MPHVRRVPARLAVVAALVALTWGPGTAPAQPGGVYPQQGDATLFKVSSRLLRARALAATGRSPAEIAGAVPGLAMRDGLVAVVVRLEGPLTPTSLADLRAAGLRVGGSPLGQPRAYGSLAPAALDELAGLAWVSTIHPMPRTGTRVGAATNQADDTLRAVNVRVFHNHDGSGVQVGVLSDSFNSALGGSVSGGTCACGTSGSSCETVVNGMDNQMSGDLPASIPVLDDCTAGSPNCDTLIDEGAALGELIYDLAPGAGFLFHSAFNSPADFAAGIGELINCGADLVVDDVFWTGQAFFQDDVIAQAAQAAVDAGVPYFSAAGNDATFGVLDSYLDSDANDNACEESKLFPDGEDLHDFGGGDRFAAITVPDGCTLYAELQWNEPFDGTLGAGAASDLDLLLLSTPADPASTSGANLLDFSITDQGCGIPAARGGDPLEAVIYTNDTGAADTVYLAVDHCCGDESVDLRIVSLSFDCATTGAGWEFEDGGAGETAIFVDPQIFGHPAARGVEAVAAAFYAEIDSGGALDPPTGQIDVEPFSSLGGAIPIYFDADGDPLPMAPETRFKPDVTTPDGTNTTFFGVDVPDDIDFDPNFFGTSAAAANAAGAATLLLDATEGKLTPTALGQMLSRSGPEVESAGLDALSGWGSVDVLGAVRSLDEGSAPLIADLEIDLDGDAFLKTPDAVLQPLQALTTLRLGNGDYSGITGLADAVIFTDGFESGDTSAWTN